MNEEQNGEAKKRKWGIYIEKLNFEKNNRNRTFNKKRTQKCNY